MDTVETSLDLPEELISRFADILSLLYHEGRNVRHLLKNGQIDVDPSYLSLRERLAKNRYEAWAQIQSLRRRAAGSASGGEAEQVFRQWFRLTVDDLIVLFEHPGWKGSAYGGNAWLPIAQMATKLRDLIDGRQEHEAARLVGLILDACHNTGRVRDKLENLDARLASQDGD